MIFIDEPRYVPLEDYHRAISHMKEKVSAYPGVIAVYQIGGLSAPGISDIDMVVVFDDDASCPVDPRKGLPRPDDYLFTHNLFGTSVSHFAESRYYTFFHDFRLLAGEDLRNVVQASASPEELIKRQWASEFLVRMLINMTVEREFGIYKLRNLLLHGKALIYDLEFLSAQAPVLMGLLEQIMEWRQGWFEHRPQNRDISSFLRGLWKALVAFLQDHLVREPLFLPERPHYRIGHNISLRPAKRISTRSRGPKVKWLPVPLPTAMARRLISLQHRLNRFNLAFPFHTHGTPQQVVDSFVYAARTMEHNQCHLPHFMPLTSSLVLA